METSSEAPAISKDDAKVMMSVAQRITGDVPQAIKAQQRAARIDAERKCAKEMLQRGDYFLASAVTETSVTCKASSEPSVMRASHSCDRNPRSSKRANGTMRFTWAALR